jgi:hypothetical protein
MPTSACRRAQSAPGGRGRLGMSCMTPTLAMVISSAPKRPAKGPEIGTGSRFRTRALGSGKDAGAAAGRARRVNAQRGGLETRRGIYSASQRLIKGQRLGVGRDGGGAQGEQPRQFCKGDMLQTPHDGAQAPAAGAQSGRRSVEGQKAMGGRRVRSGGMDCKRPGRGLDGSERFEGDESRPRRWRLAAPPPWRSRPCRACRAPSGRGPPLP